MARPSGHHCPEAQEPGVLKMSHRGGDMFGALVLVAL